MTVSRPGWDAYHRRLRDSRFSLGESFTYQTDGGTRTITGIFHRGSVWTPEAEDSRLGYADSNVFEDRIRIQLKREDGPFRHRQLLKRESDGRWYRIEQFDELHAAQEDVTVIVQWVDTDG